MHVDWHWKSNFLWMYAVDQNIGPFLREEGKGPGTHCMHMHKWPKKLWMNHIRKFITPYHTVCILVFSIWLLHHLAQSTGQRSTTQESKGMELLEECLMYAFDGQQRWSSHEGEAAPGHLVRLRGEGRFRLAPHWVWKVYVLRVPNVVADMITDQHETECSYLSISLSSWLIRCLLLSSVAKRVSKKLGGHRQGFEHAR